MIDANTVRFLHDGGMQGQLDVHCTAVGSCLCCNGIIAVLGLCWLWHAGLPPPPDRAAALPHALPSLMLFAICWSVGGSCDKAGRALFDSFLRGKVAELVQDQQQLQQLPTDALMPEGAPVYDWCYDHKVRGTPFLQLSTASCCIGSLAQVGLLMQWDYLLVACCLGDAFLQFAMRMLVGTVQWVHLLFLMLCRLKHGYLGWIPFQSSSATPASRSHRL